MTVQLGSLFMIGNPIMMLVPLSAAWNSDLKLHSSGFSDWPDDILIILLFLLH
jgi:hypothetical protein